MNRNVLNFALVAILLFSSASNALKAQRPRPVMDFTSVLNTLDISAADGTLQFNQKDKLFAAFIPKNGLLDVTFRKLGEPAELHATGLATEEHYGKFVRARSIGPLDEKQLTEPGDYLVTYRCNGVPITQFRVTLDVRQNGRKKVYKLNGPWQRWVQMCTPLKNEDNVTPRVVCWLRNESQDPETPERYSFQVRRKNELIYEADDAIVDKTYWMPFTLKLRFPRNIGGNLVTPIEFFNRDGEFTLQVRKGDSLVAIYPFKVMEGRLQLNERQLVSHRPAYEYMITRYAGSKSDGSEATNVFWLDRIDSEELAARVAATDRNTNNNFVTDARRANWKYTYSADPERPFEIKETNFEAADKAHIAVGDELIVYGTGYPRGVAYIRVGDEANRQEPRNLPQGETYDSGLFYVCGKKIVLMKHKTMFIYGFGKRPFDSDRSQRGLAV